MDYCTCGHSAVTHLPNAGCCCVEQNEQGLIVRCKCARYSFGHYKTLAQELGLARGRAGAYEARAQEIDLERGRARACAGDQINPAHYKSDPSGVECIQITRHRNFNIGNAIKYLWRAGLKNSEATKAEDLEKALWYIKDELGLITGSGEHAGQMALKQSMQQEGLIK